MTGRRAVLRDGNRQPGRRRRPRARRPAAAQRPHVHHARRARAGRRAAAGVAAAAHQRRPAADERVPVRRHLGPAAGARAGRVLPRHRRDPGVPDREQQPAGGVRAVQRRRDQPDDAGRARTRCTGNAFEFLRHEALNARNYFQTAKPRSRSTGGSQFGGTLGGPLAARPDVLLRRLPGTAAVDRAHGHFDGADRAPAPGDLHGSDRREGAGRSSIRSRRAAQRAPPFRATRFPLGTHGSGRGVAAAALSAADVVGHGQQLPPHRARGRRPGSVGRAGRSRLCGPRPAVRAAVVLPRRLHARHAAPRGQRRHDRHARAAGHDGVGVRVAAISTRSRPRCCNEVRFGDTRRSGRSHGGHARLVGGRRAEHSRHSVDRAFPTRCRRSSSAATSSSDRRRTRRPTSARRSPKSADTLTWVKGRHLVKAGFDWRWERLNVIQPPSPTGSFTFNAIGSDQPGSTNTGTPFASFLLGQVQLFSIDLQQDQIQERAHFQEYFVQDDWKVASSPDAHAGPALHAELSVAPRSTARPRSSTWRRSVLDYPGTDPVRPLKKDNFGPRFGATYRLTDRHGRQRRLRARLDRDGGHHDAVHDADVPVPADRVAARARQRVARVPAEERPDGGAACRRRRSRGSARACSPSTRRSGPATRSSGTPRSSAQLTTDLTVEAAYVGSIITHVGIPDTNLNQLTADQLAHGRAAARPACRIRTSASSRDPRRSATRRSPSRSCSSRSRSTRPSAGIATTSARRAIRGSS